MIEFGKTLRAAREAKGLSVAQLAEQTHMTPARVEELENENFTSFPAAIYGRGFVRLYCQAVGLDPKPLADEFTEIFNGNRDVEIRERAGEEEVGGAREEVGGERSCPSVDVNIPLSTSTFPTSSSEEANPPLSTSTSTSDSEEANPPHAPSLSRYAAPLHDRPRVSIPPAVWRIGILACAAILVLWGLIVGVCALYRATGGTAGSEQPESAPVAEAAPESAAPRASEANAPSSVVREARTPQDIPALYID